MKFSLKSIKIERGIVLPQKERKGGVQSDK
jgi:hypothetical protein|nr:MAG TPA: hypothetical protein [Caudoviricetes sp.]DAU32069.1 MAG TPA: hypothetical protein [Caudoviricetes sp.]